MSFDHKPEDTPERNRIETAGGRVTPDGRVNGGLNLSRAIGDHAYKTNKALSLQGKLMNQLLICSAEILKNFKFSSLIYSINFEIFRANGVAHQCRWATH